jgi:hypothetical protein
LGGLLFKAQKLPRATNHPGVPLLYVFLLVPADDFRAAGKPLYGDQASPIKRKKSVINKLIR